MTRFLSALALVVVLGAPVVAHAHGDVESTSPADGDHVVDPPTEVTITFSQPPTADSKFEVVDGCDDDVLAAVEGEGPNPVLRIRPGGSTGAWTVRYRVISATDGHLTRGNFTFLVGRGPLQCGEDPSVDDTPDVAPTGDTDGALGADDGDFPIVPVVIGGGVIVALAVVVRMMSGR